MPAPHPEIAWGIPANVVTARTMPAKEAAAQMANYSGPLTLLDAVRAGQLHALEAVELIEQWYRGGGVGRGLILNWTAQIEAAQKKLALEAERRQNPNAEPEPSQDPPEEAPEVSQDPQNRPSASYAMPENDEEAT